MKKLNVALVGLSFGLEFVAIYCKHPDIDKVYVVDKNEKLLNIAKERYSIPDERCFTDLQDVLDIPEIDAVHLVTPPATHAPFSVRVLNAGKHCGCTIPMGMSIQALPEFGAFYESGNSYYILTGQSNPDKNDSAEVYRVTKYSKDWKVQGSASLYGEHTQYPFGFGSARMTMDGSYLYVRTCHVMYNSHQANLSFSVNTDSMSIVDKLTDVRFWQEGYASHSFNQFVQIDQGKMVTLDQCDAYPSRALVLYKYNTDLSGGKFAPKYNSWEPSKPDPTYCTKTDILKVSGMSGDNYTGTSAGALEYSDSNWLAAGNFDTDGSGSSRNVFVAAVPKDGGSPVVRYFSNYAGTNDSAATPHLVKTGSNSFVLLWSSKGKVYYTAIDGSGQQTGKTYSMDGNLSDCVPSVINGKLIWYL